MPAKDPAAAGSSPTTPRSRTPAGPGSPPRATSDISIAMHHDRDDDRSRTVHRSRRLRPNAAILHNPKPHSSRTRRQYETTVPNTADRVAQTAAAMLLEEKLEPIFHPDSYGYRPGRNLSLLPGDPPACRGANHKRLGTHAIANWLRDAGLSTRAGKPWTYKAILTILRNRTYLGEVHFRGTWSKGTHPSLVEKSLFDTA